MADAAGEATNARVGQSDEFAWTLSDHHVADEVVVRLCVSVRRCQLVALHSQIVSEILQHSADKGSRSEGTLRRREEAMRRLYELAILVVVTVAVNLLLKRDDTSVEGCGPR